MRPVVQIADGVWRIPTLGPDWVNSYALAETDGSVTLVDVGVRQLGWRRVLAGLAAIGAAPTDVRRLVLTHAHSDHAGGVRGLADRAPGLPVAAHQADADALRRGRPAPSDPAAGLAGRIATVMAPLLGFPKVTPAETLADGDVIDAAGGLEVHHTPGHTAGHMSLLHRPTGVLITGDVIFNVRDLRWPVAALCTDIALNRRSAEVLTSLDFDVAAFTHGPEITRDARATLRAFVRSRTAAE